MSDAPWKPRTSAEMIGELEAARTLDELPADFVAHLSYCFSTKPDWHTFGGAVFAAAKEADGVRSLATIMRERQAL